MIEEIQQLGLLLCEAMPGEVWRFASHPTTLSECPTTYRACVRLTYPKPGPGSQASSPLGLLRRSAVMRCVRDLLAALLPDTERMLGPDHPSNLTTRRGLENRTGSAG